MHKATYTPHTNTCTSHLVQVLSVHILHLGVSGVCTRGWASTVSVFKWNGLWWIVILVDPHLTQRQSANTSTATVSTPNTEPATVIKW